MALTALVYGGYRQSLAASVISEQDIKITQLRGFILQLDEVLTMSARMAAHSGDRQWEKRYRSFEPKLDAAIKELRSIAPGVHNEQARSWRWPLRSESPWRCRTSSSGRPCTVRQFAIR